MEKVLIAVLGVVLRVRLPILGSSIIYSFGGAAGLDLAAVLFIWTILMSKFFTFSAWASNAIFVSD